jgi:transcription elongation factor Elf1
MTEQQIALALNDQCPFCENEEYEMTSLGDIVEEGESEQQFQCSACGKSWWIVYKAVTAYEG